MRNANVLEGFHNPTLGRIGVSFLYPKILRIALICIVFDQLISRKRSDFEITAVGAAVKVYRVRQLHF